MSGIQFYAISVFSLVSVASLMAINAMDLSDFIRIIATCAALIGMYSFFFRILQRHDVSVLAFIGSLIVLPSLPYISYIAYLVGALGWVVLIRHEWKFNNNQLLCLPVLFVAIFGSHIISDFQYHNSLTMGTIYIDTLFHAAIAAMYSHYGVASVGLDGLVPIPYHILSHKIMAGVATLSGFETLAVYSYLYFAMGPLLLAFALAGFACQLNSKLKFNQALLGIALMMLAIVSVPVFKWVVLWDVYFESESYLIALVIFTVSLATFKRWVEDGAVGLFQLATSLSLLILAGLTKGSVGLLGVCVFGLLGITKFRIFKYWLLLAIASVFLYFGVIDSATNAQQMSYINSFHFITTYVRVPLLNPPTLVKVILFLGGHFLTVWVCFVIGIRKLGSEYYKTIEFQVLFALLFPALFFSLTFDMWLNTVFFSTIPVVVSLSFLLPSLSGWLNTIKVKHVIVMTVLAFLLMLPVIGKRSFVVQYLSKGANIDRLQDIVKQLHDIHDKSPTNFLVKIVNPELLVSKVVKVVSKSTKVGAMQDIVKQLHDIRDKSPKNVLVKIENPELLVSKIGCDAYWFLPAVMERPLIDGLPDNDLCPRFEGLHKEDSGTSVHKSVHRTFYGLIDYDVNHKKLISEDFKVVRVKL